MTIPVEIRAGGTINLGGIVWHVEHDGKPEDEG